MNKRERLRREVRQAQAVERAEITALLAEPTPEALIRYGDAQKIAMAAVTEWIELHRSAVQHAAHSAITDELGRTGQRTQEGPDDQCA